MSGQMNIFELLYPDRINPIAEVAKIAQPYWKDSREKIKRFQDSDIKILAKVVRHQYCPYGASGHYGCGGDPNTLSGYDMRSDVIYVEWLNEEKERNRRAYSWEDFAREIADLIWSGNYEEENNEN